MIKISLSLFLLSYRWDCRMWKSCAGIATSGALSSSQAFGYANLASTVNSALSSKTSAVKESSSLTIPSSVATRWGPSSNCYVMQEPLKYSQLIKNGLAYKPTNKLIRYTCGSLHLRLRILATWALTSRLRRS